MAHYRNFSKALDVFREHGGAMNYHPAASGLSETWEVAEHDELAERITCSPLEATRKALAEGGFSPDQIEAELADWKT